MTILNSNKENKTKKMSNNNNDVIKEIKEIKDMIGKNFNPGNTIADNLNVIKKDVATIKKRRHICDWCVIL